MPVEVMVVLKDLGAILGNDLCDVYPTTIKLTIKSQQGGKEILWCPAYFPYEVDEVPSGTFIRSSQYGGNKGMGIIAGCDVNAWTFQHQRERIETTKGSARN